ncbi:MAG: flagellar basal body L-ring protein FlgH [Geminicoccaceae bacterium]
MRGLALVPSLLALALVAGCARLLQIGQEPAMTPPGQPMAAISPPVREALPKMATRPAEPQAVASLWQPVQLFRDQRARSVGDILTVTIEIDDRAKINNETKRERDGAEGVNIGTIFGLENAVDDVLPDDLSFSAGVDVSSDSTSRGTGSIARDEKIELKIAAMVTDVLPNGNLVIRGSQEIRVNYELRDLQVAGIIRPEDISRDNTIAYEKMAEARLAYGGRGQLYQLQQPRYGQQVLDVVSPF